MLIVSVTRDSSRKGDTVVSRDVPQPYTFLSLDSCQKTFLWVYKEADLDPDPVVGLALHEVREVEKFDIDHNSLCWYVKTWKEKDRVDIACQGGVRGLVALLEKWTLWGSHLSLGWETLGGGGVGEATCP